MPAASINCLAVVLKELGWSYTRLIAELRRHASVTLPKTESMVTLVSRWVNNHQQPDDFYRDLLSRATGRARAELFGNEPVALTGLPSGLVVARSVEGLPTTGVDPLSSGGDGLVAWLGQQEPELKDGSVERRSFLASLALLGVDLTALAPASSAQVGSAGERALTVDGALLRDLDLTTAAYERMRHRVPGRHLMRQVVGQIELTEDVLRGSLWPAQKQWLLANLSQTTSLLSWLQFFDRGDRAAARGWLMRSTRAAQESGDPELMMLAMIRGAEQQTYSGLAHQSTQLLDAAERLAASGSSPKALSWILAANAEAHATLGELDPSLALLDRSLDALRPGRTGDDPSWAEYWNRSKVLGYMGACHMRMRRPESAGGTRRRPPLGRGADGQAPVDLSRRPGDHLHPGARAGGGVPLGRQGTRYRRPDALQHDDGADDRSAARPRPLEQRSLRAAARRTTPRPCQRRERGP
jgi:hypothetical protein